MPKTTIPSERKKRGRYFAGARASASSIWPVVQRELRAGARKNFNHWLRVGSGGGAMVFLFLLTQDPRAPSATVGSRLFITLHTLMCLILMVAVPLMTADCIAREKREGTLGLLFLTPLNSRGIVIGKTLVQAVRALTIWLSTLPILAIPLLMGGVTQLDLTSAIAMELILAIAGLAGGVIASTLTEDRNWALFIAAAMAAFFVLCVEALMISYFFIKVPRLYSFDSQDLLQAGLTLTTMIPGNLTWSTFLAVFKLPIASWLWMVGQSLLFSIGLLYVALRIAAHHIESSWHDKIPTPGKQCRDRNLGTFFGRQQQSRRQRMLDRNPIAWLQQYSWKARASKWGLAVLVLVVAGAAFKVAGSGNFQNLMTTYGWLHFLFVVMYALAGVSGFWREKQSGALELILITPLSVNSIILGRTFGLWKQFLPAAVSLVVFHAAALVSDPDSISFERTVLPGWIAICSFFSLPVFATYAALRAGNMVMAGFLTCLGTMLGGMLGMELASFVSIILDLQESTLLLFLALVSISVGYASFVGLTFFLLRHSLSRRIYSF